MESLSLRLHRILVSVQGLVGRFNDAGNAKGSEVAGIVCDGTGKALK
jgi:hypothetical protein